MAEGGRAHKPWYKRWWAITIFVIIGLSILNNLLTEKKPSAPAESELQTEITKQASSVKEEPSQPVLYSMNQPISVDYLTYTVTKAETFTEMGNEFMNKKTEGMFVKIYLKILNNAKETKEIFTPRFTLMDDKGRKFERLSDDMFYVADALEFGKALQPGLSASGAIVFEIPTDVKGLALMIRGDWISSSEIVVKIDSITNIGKDITLEQKVKGQIEESMSKCNLPFKCKSSCSQYLDVGQKDCPAGQVCCMAQ